MPIRLRGCLILLLALFSLAFPIGAHSGGMTVEPAGEVSGDGEGGTGGDTASGGSAVGTRLDGLYDPGTGSGIVLNPSATTFAQEAGLNGYQAGNGVTAPSSDSISDPVSDDRLGYYIQRISWDETKKSRP